MQSINGSFRSMLQLVIWMCTSLFKAFCLNACILQRDFKELSCKDFVSFPFFASAFNARISSKCFCFSALELCSAFRIQIKQEIDIASGSASASAFRLRNKTGKGNLHQKAILLYSIPLCCSKESHQNTPGCRLKTIFFHLVLHLWPINASHATKENGLSSWKLK